ncbi:TOPRIM and DUF927 domain-containing protein [Escherichia coli]|uniref:TOPRIM and DUF927 domain-containing protein n=1 Tax=Escherichia coli TaxID=562 RepID=UPI001F4D2716|nr:DUF927 domain-containing protein [Escherichia coli]UNF02637.1 DUF927 domain-containing protein [Escherichia coli]
MTIQTVTQISAAARGKWPVILQMLRIDVPENGRHGPCPKCGGKDRFRLDDLDGRGTWICSQCGNGDGLDLVKLVTGYSVRKAAQEVAQVLNVPDVQELPVKPARQKAPKRDMGLTVAALMKESHTGESAYLTGKGFAGYISLCKPERRVTCVSRTGWHGQVYVLQDEVSGEGAEGVILQTTSVQGRDFRVSGTTEEWREHVSRYCTGNSRVAFAVSLAFAAPLLRLVGMDGGGYHLKGESTDGKTTTMKAATSVCGGPDYWQTWRATGNALEGCASRRNDAAMMLDEIREVDGREAGNIAYMLANGQGKGRAGTDGELRTRKQWRLLFFSTGELSLTEHAAKAGERTFAGMEVRMIQIPSDSGKFGVFEELHGFDSGKALAEHLEWATSCYYGSPFREWLKALTADLNGLTAQAKSLMKEYAAALTPKDAGNQVGRAVNRFALVAMAGELATRLGITGWPEGEALRATRVCLNAWLKDRGHTANQEDIAALEQVRSFFTANQYSRFADWYDERNRPGNMVGWRRVEKGSTAQGTEAVTTFYVMPSGWKEICRGFDPRKVARLCADRGYLLPSTDGKLQTTIRPPEMNPRRLYVFNSEVPG